MMYYAVNNTESLDRGIEKQIADLVYELLKSYNMSLDDVIRIVVRELALTLSRVVIDTITDWYNRYKKR